MTSSTFAPRRWLSLAAVLATIGLSPLLAQQHACVDHTNDPAGCQPSTFDTPMGWRSGDLDGTGDGRGLGVAGTCIFVGHANGAGVRHTINIFKIQPNPDRQPPVQLRLVLRRAAARPAPIRLVLSRY